METKTVHKALTIAGSDSSGGAGLQADLKTFLTHNVLGCTAVTAVTAQNTKGLQECHSIPAEMVSSQIKSVLDDIGANAFKIGMVYDSDIIKSVSQTLKEYKEKTNQDRLNLVIDPMTVSYKGDKFLKEDAYETFIRELVPQALILTITIPETKHLFNIEIKNLEDVKNATKKISNDYNIPYVLMKGGHLLEEGKDEVTDIVYCKDSGEHCELKEKVLKLKKLHGASDTISASITAELAKGTPPMDAIKKAKQYLSKSLQNVINIGELAFINHASTF